MVIRQVNLPVIARYWCLLVCLFFSQDGSVPLWFLCSTWREATPLANIKTFLFRLWCERGRSGNVQELIAASFVPKFREVLLCLFSIAAVETHDNRRCWCVHTHTKKKTLGTSCNACIQPCANMDEAFLLSHTCLSCVSRRYAMPLSHISLHFQFHPLFTQLFACENEDNTT